MSLRRSIPWWMVGFRALAGPSIAVLAMRMPRPQLWLGGLIAAGTVSDIYDGILARRWRTETAALRVADSSADIVFWLGILTAAIVRHGAELRARLGLVIVVLVFEAIHLSFGWLKFGRMPSFHTYSAKLWGALLAAAAIALLGFDRWAWLVTVSLLWGIACEAESLTIAIVLPEWTYNVKTLRRAIALRREMLAARETQASVR
ncbi:MAG TPA: CDP-alcohol phosphatidyltransferase family protein [Terracidiphilus sp.]|nr:CDP-alcohol phosphatidyltransferase family protein [Terracidiphilus sp.]